MMQLFKTILMFIVVSSILTGCFRLSDYEQQVIEKNQQLSDTVKQQVDERVDQGADMVKAYTKAQITVIADQLSQVLKDNIDEWLEDQGLNRYGDPVGTMYAGGTPLFNEATGEMKDMYEYILEQHPELIETLQLQ